VAASGAHRHRLGLAGVPVAAETVALHTLFELVRMPPVRACTCAGCRSAAGVALVRQARKPKACR
jgi:dihydroorotase